MTAGRVLATGGAGFLGSHFVRSWLEKDRGELLNIDLLTYAGSRERLEQFADDPRYRLLVADVADPVTILSSFRDFRANVVAHFAAESHVTRSELDPDRFMRTNVEGTRAMLEAAAANGVQRFIHISTDEVYGPILRGAFREEDKLPGDDQATSPYAKSKAIADDIARGFADEMEVVVVRPTNCFGPWQYPEKAFARWVSRALTGRPVLVWGDGLYVRQWLFAQDLASAVTLIMETPSPEPVYNIGPRHDPEITNLDLARWLLEYLKLPGDQLKLTEYDRPDHDRRYAVDPSLIEALGWKPGDAWDLFAETVDWYRANESWWRSMLSEAESIYEDEVRR
jgi:dTDP-glucose 4,6-dehydratase